MKPIDKLDIRDARGGVVISVKASPGSSRDRLVGLLGGHLKVATSAPPQRGKANTAIARTLARALGVDARAVSLAAGATTRHKKFLIRGLTAEQVRARLAKLT